MEVLTAVDMARGGKGPVFIQRRSVSIYPREEDGKKDRKGCFGDGGGHIRAQRFVIDVVYGSELGVNDRCGGCDAMDVCLLLGN